MKTTISVQQGKLCFHHIQQPTDIMYQFEDRIGIFLQKFPLTFEINNHMVTLDLKHHFSSGIISGLKIKMVLDVEAREPIILDDINPLYIVTIHVDKEALYITLTAKDTLVTIHCQGNQLQLISDYKCTTYLGQLVAGTMLPTAKYFVTKDKHIIMEDMLTMMQHLAIRQQRWSVYVQLKDDCGNQHVEKVQLTDWIHQNKALLAQYSVDYHQKDNFLLYGNVQQQVTSLPISIQAVNQRLYSLTCDRELAHDTIYLALRSRQDNPFHYREYVEFPTIKQSAIIDLGQLHKIYTKDGDNFDVLIGKNFETARFVIPTNHKQIDTRYVTLSNTMNAKFYINGRGGLSLYVLEKTQSQAYEVPKIAVLGTCFSRNGLNTSPYFNPDYKKYMNCVFTQFHSRLDALNAVPAPASLMQQYKQHHEFEHIARDMAKTFYDELRQSGAEILVIDLYADALLTSLKLNNGSKITYNYLIKDNPNLGDYVSEWNAHEFDNDTDYYNEWLADLHKFMHHITNIIPESHIILNRGRLAGKYSEEGQLKTFSTIQQIKKANEIWENLDNLLLQHYPQVKVIDLTGKQYHADKNHPFGFSYSHYESQYYKDYFSELVKQVLLIKAL